MLEPPCILPTELAIFILSIAASHDRATAARLCLLSNCVRELVEPILYRVLILRNTSLGEASLRVYSPKFHAFARSFGVINTSLTGALLMAVQPREAQSGEIPLSGIRNLAAADYFYDSLISAAGVEEIHVFPPRSVGSFPQLQRLHLCWSSTLWVDKFRIYPWLTHVAWSVPESLRKSDLESAVVRLLKEHRPLVLLLVRLLPGTSVESREATQSGSLQARLASIRDPRLVVKRVSMDGRARSLLDEWERNALSGESIWDEAQTKLSARRLVANTF